MKVYLMKSGSWKLFEDPSPDEFLKRNIIIGYGATIGEWATIGEGARIGEWATIGEWARIGDGARIKNNFDIIMLGPIGSRKAMLTAYLEKGKIKIGTGCFIGSIEEFEDKVKKVHGDNEHGKDYLCALDYVRARFKAVNFGESKKRRE